MKYILTAIILLQLLLSHSALAEDSIKVLMHPNPYAALPSDHAELVDTLKGRIFINGEFYSGELEILRDDKGLYVVNSVPFEKYIEGVVYSELGKDWELEALKAQAVISRTYALYHKNINAGKNYHLTSSELHQLYRNKNAGPIVRLAVRITEDQVLSYNGEPIKAFYHSTCEGKTELPNEVWGENYPYIKSVSCNSNNSPFGNWQRRFTLHELQRALKINAIEDIDIASYTETGRVKTVQLLLVASGDESLSYDISATRLRKLLGYSELPSTKFSLKKAGEQIIFAGKGFGHGVGLSQWGALAMARQGKNYREILSHYYPNTQLVSNEDLHYKAGTEKPQRKKISKYLLRNPEE